MDVLLRLRVLIWVLVISLWGVMVYQYLGEEEQDMAKMKRIVPYDVAPRATGTPDLNESALASARPTGPTTYAPASVQPVILPSVLPSGHAVNPPGAGSGLPITPSPDYVGPATDANHREPDGPGISASPPPKHPSPTHRLEDRTRTAAADMPAPPGFARSTSRHFVVFSEQYPASERFLELIESLHSNLMLDLAPFSPWASNERTTIFLFKNQGTYRRVTGRPIWSGGASSVTKRKLYVYESEELPGIVAHELTHIYFDGFFLSGTTDPLWLSEGMATLVQVERGLAAPNWLRENLERLENGDGFPVEKLIAVNSTAGWPDAKVRLWYAQSYSIVRFLIRTQYRSSFYKFSANLRDGRPTPEALYRAYGAPYTRVIALEHAWRYELSRAQMAKNGGQ
ncbi:MAG: hypothetical protein COV48_04095 [Elusimicrobia bacterium CG11_big_fil_rev_8_21_14_0_20_64_6]|nr:MAG: hypothetical protein COV48_04095 [Elusimicrobia bacterium CG11_big_fil_rev_8_21_14_0_20_64_6]